MHLNSGTLLQGGKYRIEKVLGQGSFGITYLASAVMNGSLGTISVKVAIKEFFSKDLNMRKSDGSVSEMSSGSLSGKYAAMFQREAKNLSHLNHKGIVNVLESFSENNTHYYVMEYIEGGSLDDHILKNGRISEADAVSYARQIGDALSYMHTHNMLHLDLKPKNIMLRSDGSVCLIDFGLSKQYDSEGEPESNTSIGLGTPGYAPLEQGGENDRKRFSPTLDVYAFGATMFKMLTGKTPPRASAIMNDGFPKELLVENGVSDKIIALIIKAMSLRKQDRFQTMSELYDGFGNFDCDEETVVSYDAESPRKFSVIYRNNINNYALYLIPDYLDLSSRESLVRESISSGYEKCRLVTQSSAMTLAQFDSTDRQEQIVLAITIENNRVSLTIAECGDGVVEIMASKRLYGYNAINIKSLYKKYQNSLNEFIQEYLWTYDSNPLFNVVIYNACYLTDLDLWKPRVKTDSVIFVDDDFVSKGLSKLASAIWGNEKDLLLIDTTYNGYCVQFKEIGFEWVIWKDSHIPARHLLECKPNNPEQKQIAFRLWEENDSGRICVLDHILNLPPEYCYDTDSLKLAVDIDAYGSVHFEVKMDNTMLSRVQVSGEVTVSLNDTLLPVLIQ